LLKRAWLISFKGTQHYFLAALFSQRISPPTSSNCTRQTGNAGAHHCHFPTSSLISLQLVLDKPYAPQITRQILIDVKRLSWTDRPSDIHARTISNWIQPKEYFWRSAGGSTIKMHKKQRSSSLLYARQVKVKC
jgi:hypothetical protein